MIRAGFLSSSERRELEVCVRSQREDHGIARRANAILLLDDGNSGSPPSRPPHQERLPGETSRCREGQENGPPQRDG